MRGGSMGRVWTCKIGTRENFFSAHGADAPMRNAVTEAYRLVTGMDPQFLYSGWGGSLDDTERELEEARFFTAAAGVDTEEQEPGPRLGYATTEDLLRELSARIEASALAGEPIHLDYRTVDSEEKQDPRMAVGVGPELPEIRSTLITDRLETPEEIRAKAVELATEYQLRLVDANQVHTIDEVSMLRIADKIQVFLSGGDV
jgi:hypothetical protein